MDSMMDSPPKLEPMMSPDFAETDAASVTGTSISVPVEREAEIWSEMDKELGMTPQLADELEIIKVEPLESSEFTAPLLEANPTVPCGDEPVSRNGEIAMTNRNKRLQKKLYYHQAVKTIKKRNAETDLGVPLKDPRITRAKSKASKDNEMRARDSSVRTINAPSYDISKCMSEFPALVEEQRRERIKLDKITLGVTVLKDTVEAFPIEVRAAAKTVEVSAKSVQKSAATVQQAADTIQQAAQTVQQAVQGIEQSAKEVTEAAAMIKKAADDTKNLLETVQALLQNVHKESVNLPLETSDKNKEVGSSGSSTEERDQNNSNERKVADRVKRTPKKWKRGLKSRRQEESEDDDESWPVAVNSSWKRKGRRGLSKDTGTPSSRFEARKKLSAQLKELAQKKEKQAKKPKLATEADKSSKCDEDSSGDEASNRHKKSAKRSLEEVTEDSAPAEPWKETKETPFPFGKPTYEDIRKYKGATEQALIDDKMLALAHKLVQNGDKTAPVDLGRLFCMLVKCRFGIWAFAKNFFCDPFKREVTRCKRGVLNHFLSLQSNFVAQAMLRCYNWAVDNYDQNLLEDENDLVGALQEATIQMNNMITSPCCLQRLLRHIEKKKHELIHKQPDLEQSDDHSYGGQKVLPSDPFMLIVQ